MAEDLEGLFVNTKPVRILVSLNSGFTDNYASAISAEVDATYSHTVRILQKLERYNLVSSEKKGRKKLVELTEKGERLAQLFGDVMKELES